MNENTINNYDYTENLKLFCKTTTSFRKEEKTDKESLIKARELVKNDMQIKIELEKNINEFIKQNPGNHCDPNTISNAVNLYKEGKQIFISSKEENKIIKKLFEVISAIKEDHLKNEIKKLTTKDKNLILKYIEDVETYGWKIKDEIIKKLHDLSK
jgi:hypothetical protein